MFSDHSMIEFNSSSMPHTFNQKQKQKHAEWTKHKSKKKKYLPSLGEETYYLSNNLKEQL